VVVRGILLSWVVFFKGIGVGGVFLGCGPWGGGVGGE